MEQVNDVDELRRQLLLKFKLFWKDWTKCYVPTQQELQNSVWVEISSGSRILGYDAPNQIYRERSMRTLRERFFKESGGNMTEQQVRKAKTLWDFEEENPPKRYRRDTVAYSENFCINLPE